MTSLIFRNATLADTDAIIALVTSAYRGQSSRTGWTTEADLLEGNRIPPDVLQDDITRNNSRVLLAYQNNELVACAHITRQDNAGYFGMFAVKPDLQGAGIGIHVITQAERIAREDLGVTHMRMHVIDLRDSLIAFYQRRGYARTGILKPFPYGDQRFGTPLRNDLRFEVLEKLLT